MSNTLERMARANPVPADPPVAAWNASVLLDEIDARRGQMAKLEETTSTPTDAAPGRSRLRGLAVAAAAFVVVLAVIGVGAWLAPRTDEGTPPDDRAHTTQPAPTTAGPTTAGPTTVAGTSAVDTGETFYTAYLEGDWDTARALASRPSLLPRENINVLWGIDVVSIRCEAGTSEEVVCLSTQVDDYTRQIDEGYAWQSEGTMVIVDGLVTSYQSMNRPDPIFDRYSAWLDLVAPGEWDSQGCSPDGSVLTAGCTEIYLSNVEAWLATDPDLKELDPTAAKVSLAEAFYTAYLEGDWDAAERFAFDRVELPQPNVNVLWGIEVVAIECELSSISTVACTATQVDDMTRQIGAAYSYQNLGGIDVRDGLVSGFRSSLLPDPVFDRYTAWLDATSPGDWTPAGCEGGGGILIPECVEIYLEQVESWLATDPDLSEVEG